MQTVQELATIEFVQLVLSLRAGELQHYLRTACPRPARQWRAIEVPPAAEDHVFIPCLCEAVPLMVYSPTLRESVLLAGGIRAQTGPNWFNATLQDRAELRYETVRLWELLHRSAAGYLWIIRLGQCPGCRTVWCAATRD